jgi:hypothetical protein
MSEVIRKVNKEQMDILCDIVGILNYYKNIPDKTFDEWRTTKLKTQFYKLQTFFEEINRVENIEVIHK